MAVIARSLRWRSTSPKPRPTHPASHTCGQCLDVVGSRRDPNSYYAVSLGGGGDNTGMLVIMIRDELSIDTIIADVGANSGGIKTCEFLLDTVAPYLVWRGLEMPCAGKILCATIVAHMITGQILPILLERWCTAEPTKRGTTNNVRCLHCAFIPMHIFVCGKSNGVRWRESPCT